MPNFKLYVTKVQPEGLFFIVEMDDKLKYKPESLTPTYYNNRIQLMIFWWPALGQLSPANKYKNYSPLYYHYTFLWWCDWFLLG